jgi:hypothetical protein
MADELLSASPHAWLSCSILGTEASIELADCRLDAARDVLQRLRRFAWEQGLQKDWSQANVNLGHLSVLRGDFAAAQSSLSEVLASPMTSQSAKLAALESLGRVHLANGELEQCELHLNEIETATQINPALRHSFSVQWSTVTRARLAMRRGQPETAADTLIAFEREHIGVLDQPLLAALSLAKAGALSAVGRHVEASRLLIWKDRCQ